MTLKLTSKIQHVELTARLLYLLSGLRAWQREAEGLRPIQNKDPDIISWELRVDTFLKDIGATEFESLKSIIAKLDKQLNT